MSARSDLQKTGSVCLHQGTMVYIVYFPRTFMLSHLEDPLLDPTLNGGDLGRWIISVFCDSFHSQNLFRWKAASLHGNRLV